MTRDVHKFMYMAFLPRHFLHPSIIPFQTIQRNPNAQGFHPTFNPLMLTHYASRVVRGRIFLFEGTPFRVVLKGNTVTKDTNHLLVSPNSRHTHVPCGVATLVGMCQWHPSCCGSPGVDHKRHGEPFFSKCSGHCWQLS